MKIRNGFVSNSSSSSFIIKLSGKFPDIRSIAKSMLHDDGYYHGDRLDEVLEKLNNVSSNTNITFDSSCERTYIQKHGNFAFVETCNNVNWNVANSSISMGDKELIEVVGENANLDWDYIEFDAKNKDEFYDVDNDFSYIELGYDDDDHECPTSGCWRNRVIYKGQILCTKCDFEYIKKNENRVHKVKKMKKIIENKD